jgi:dimethylargininase
MDRPFKWLALTREVAPSIVDCELTHLHRESIDLEKARLQHSEYCGALSSLGVRVITLPHGSFADGVFVEDPAFVVDELAVINRLGVRSREKEVESVARALSEYRELRYLTSPATLEGGDILRIGKDVYVGVSGRSNDVGVSQLRDLLAPLGYRVTAARVEGCLHFKSACSYLGKGCVLVQPRWIDPAVFKGLEVLEVDPAEPFAANALYIDDTVLYPASFPRTLDLLEKRGFRVMPVDNSELLKAESALTCMSLILKEWI